MDLEQNISKWFNERNIIEGDPLTIYEIPSVESNPIEQEHRVDELLKECSLIFSKLKKIRKEKISK